MSANSNPGGEPGLFAEEKKPPMKTDFDPSQTFDGRMRRFLHYIETKGMNEQWIEMAEGEIMTVIDALADYYDIVSVRIETIGDAYGKSVWEIQLGKIKQIQAKLEESIGYSRDAQLEICMKRRPRKDNDIGGDALTIAANR